MLVNKNIFVISSIDNSYYKYLFYYLQSNKNSSKQNKPL